MKISFVAPYEDITAYPVRLLSSILKEAGHTTKIVFMPTSIKDAEDGIRENCIQALCSCLKDTELVGFSFLSCHLQGVKQLSRGIRNHLAVPIIWGGKHVSAQPEDALNLADFIAVGESDTALPHFAAALEGSRDPNSIPGIWPVGGQGLNKTAFPPLNMDLDGLPFPDYSLDNHFIWNGNDLVLMDDRIFEQHCSINEDGGKRYQTMGSRGCPHSCSYCFSYKQFYHGQTYLRFRTPDNILCEIKEIVHRFPFIQSILLSDDNFFAQKMSVLESFTRQYKQEVGLPFHCLAHPATLKKEKLELLVDAGLNHLQVGIQTLSPTTQTLYRRGPAVERIINGCKVLNQFKDKLIPRYDFITDNPFEEKVDQLATLKMLCEFPTPYKLNLFSLVFLPGTQLHEKAENHAIEPNWQGKYEFVHKNYFNFLFPLFASPVPRAVFKILLLRPVVFVMDLRPVVNCLFWLKGRLKRLLGRQ